VKVRSHPGLIMAYQFTAPWLREVRRVGNFFAILPFYSRGSTRGNMRGPGS